MPRCFTYGEASIVVQGFVVYLTNLYFRLIEFARKTTECVQNATTYSCVIYSNMWSQSHKHLSEMEQLSMILQVSNAAT